MNRLILNTTNSDLVVLLQVGEEVFAKVEAGVKKHNEIILPLIKELLEEHGMQLKDIDEYGVVVGPGSFTGIRVGIATIKAFRDVFNKPSKGINNLSVLFETAKNYANYYAVEGSNNSYFVGEKIGDKLFVNNRNLSADELKNLARTNKIACFYLSEQMKNSELNFVQVEFDKNALVRAFDSADDERLVPIYYQLSQAENDKINKANVNIRKAESGDISSIFKIETENFELGQTGEKPQTEAMIFSIINNDMPNFVASVNDRVVGYIFCEKTDEINISRIAVDKDFQNHGIATKLINFVEEIAKGDGLNLSLEVSKNNLRAMRLYEKLGFKLRRIRKNYYADRSDCVEMIKKIG